MYKILAKCGDPQVKADPIAGVQVEYTSTKNDWDIKSLEQKYQVSEDTVVTVRILEASDPSPKIDNYLDQC